MTHTPLLPDAFRSLIDGLERAAAALTDAELHPPMGGDLDLAEGHRYLLGQLHRLIETEIHQDPLFPYFQRHPWTLSGYTIPNPDALYLYAPISAEERYWIRGRAAGPPPHYVIFEAHSMSPGDSGELSELWDGSRYLTGTLDSTDLHIEEDGRFEILVAADRPADFEGNFIASRSEAGDASKLYLRELFADWDREQALDLEIFCEGQEGRAPRRKSAAERAEQIHSLGLCIDHQIRFWSHFFGFLLDPFDRSETKGPFHVIRNQMLEPRPAGMSTGGGQSTNLFAGGLFDLADDEAMIVELRVPEEPLYIGMHLSNLWGEPLDYANRSTSLNHLQAAREADGTIRYAIAHRDPGVANWLDTAGYTTGYVTIRTTFADFPAPDRCPVTSARVVPVGEIAAAMGEPARVSPEERRALVHARQRHVARRYRQY